MKVRFITRDGCSLEKEGKFFSYEIRRPLLRRLRYKVNEPPTFDECSVSHRSYRWEGEKDGDIYIYREVEPE